MGRVFTHRQEVAFGDVDWARILYYPRFLHYCHVAFEAFMREATGSHYERFLAEKGLGFPTVHLDVDYQRPMPYGVTLTIRVSIVRLGERSMEVRYRAETDTESPNAEARVTNVLVDMSTFRSMALPDWLRACLSPYLEDAETGG